MTAECESPCLSIRWPKPTIRCLLAKATHTHRSALSGSQSRETSLRRLIGAPTQAIREHGRCPPAPALSLSLSPPFTPPRVTRLARARRSPDASRTHASVLANLG